jgi:hypothetical protein
MKENDCSEAGVGPAILQSYDATVGPPDFEQYLPIREQPNCNVAGQALFRFQCCRPGPIPVLHIVYDWESGTF